MSKFTNPNYTVPAFFAEGGNIDFIMNTEREVSHHNPHWFAGNAALELIQHGHMTRKTRALLQIVGTILLVAAIAVAVMFVCSISVAHADGATMSTSEVYQYLTDYQEWSPDLVREIQVALNKKMAKVKGYKKIAEDGDLGPGTDYAIKQFQKKNGLTVDGICGGQTLKALGITDTSEHPRYAPNLLEAFEKSTNGIGVHLNLNSHLVEVYQKGNDGWELIRVMSCATGSIKNNTMTKVRNKILNGSGHSAIYGKNSSGKQWAGDNAVAIGGGDFFHSVLRWKSGGKWKRDSNSALGTFCSHGCIRLDLEDSKWVKKTFTKGTALVIDNRSWNLSRYANGGTVVN